MVQPDSPQMTIWRIHIACWKPKSTNPHSEYVIPTAFPQQQSLKERTSMLRYTYVFVEQNKHGYDQFVIQKEEEILISARCFLVCGSSVSHAET